MTDDRTSDRSDRLDDLLDRAIETGEIPGEATPDERAELASLLMAVSSLRADAASVNAEADASLPTARARFQRHLEAERGPAVPTLPRPEAKSPRGGLFGLPRKAIALGWVGVVGAVAIAVVAALQVSTGTESAYAAELDEGDYLQVDGIVSEVSDDRIEIESPFGKLDIDIDDATTLVANAGGELPEFVPGRVIRASGTIDGGKRLDAATISVSGDLQPNPEKKKFERLDDGPLDGFAGDVLWYSSREDGSRGKVALRAAEDERYLLVEVDREALASLSALEAARPGRYIDLRRDDRGQLDLRPAFDEPGFPRECQPGLGGYRPNLPQLCGAVSSVSGTTLVVDGPGGTTDVEITRRTRIVAGPESGLDNELLSDDLSLAEGHVVVISGGGRPDRGPVKPDVIVVGPPR